MALKWKIYWLIFAITLAVYATMLTWSLPFISTEAGGLIPFDMRPAGYSFAEAQEFLVALSPAGRAFYLGTQHSLDLAYPALLAIVLTGAAWGLTRQRLRWLGIVAAVAAVAGAAADYTENARVSRMLGADASTLDPQLVESASFATLVKSGATTVAMVLVLALLVAAFFARRGAKS